MKTNQMLQVEFKHGILEIGHIDYMGDLNQLFLMGNQYRAGARLPVRYMQDWLKLTTTQEFITYVEKELGRKAVTATRGKRATTKAHLYILLDAAAYLSPELKFEIYDTFINRKLLQFRDLGGDKFLDLNGALVLKAEDVLGKPAHQGHYINIAKIIRSRVLADGVTWNNTTPEAHNERTRIEIALTTMLHANVVRDWDHLKELAAIV